MVVIDEAGDNLGPMTTQAALRLAQESDIDLIEVSPKANPPVCRLMGYGKWQYLQSQKTKKQKNLETKIVRLTFKIGDHDRDVRAKQTSKFLHKGHKVKIEMQLRGREQAFKPQAREIIMKFVEGIPDAVVDQSVSIEGGRLSALISKKS